MRPHAAYGRNFDTLDVAIVDESSHDAGVLRSILTGGRVGRVRLFARSEDALDAFVSDPPHLIVCNWQLSPGDAETFLRLLRSAEGAPTCFTPIIAVSGRPTLTVIARALRAGAHHVIAKPVSPRTLLRTLRAVVADDRPMVLDKEGRMIQVAGSAERLADIEGRRWAALGPSRRAAALARRSQRLQATIDLLFVEPPEPEMLPPPPPPQPPRPEPVIIPPRPEAAPSAAFAAIVAAQRQADKGPPLMPKTLVRESR